MRTRDVFSAVREALADEVPDVRQAAAEALPKIECDEK
jgi:HEAT repeat protein